MTRAADRLIVGGCMPGNRNEVRAAVLVRSDLQGAGALRAADAGGAAAGRRGEALLPGRGRGAGDRHRRRPRRRRRRPPSCRPGCEPPRRASRRPNGCCGPPSADDRRGPRRRARRADRRARAGAAARRAGASAAAVAAGDCRRRDGATPRPRFLARNADASWPEAERDGAGRPRAGADRRSPLRRACSRQAAAPRCRSSAGCSSRTASRCWSPARSTGWW